jgi:hypothetical protein
VERQGSQVESLNVNVAFDERRYFETGRLTAEETLSLFRATFDSPVGRQVMVELMRRWHFFDPILADPESVQKRRCVMELMILSGMWHPEGMPQMAAACTKQAGPGWIERMLTGLCRIPWRRKKIDRSNENA